MDNKDLDLVFKDYFYQIVDQAQNGITLCDPYQDDNPLIYVNQAFSDIFEYSFEEAIGQNCRFLQNDDRDQQALGNIREAIKNHSSATAVLRNYTKSGRLIYNEIKIDPIFDKETNQLKYFLGIQKNITDIFESKKHYLDSIYEKISTKIESKPLGDLNTTDYKEIVQDLQIYQSEILAQNDELLEKEKRVEALNYEFTSLFQNAPLPFLLIDFTLQIKRFNSIADEYFGFSHSKLQIKSLFNFTTKQYIQELISWLHNKEYLNSTLEINMITINKTIKRFKVQAKPYSLNESWLIVTLVDIQEEYEIKTNLEAKVQEELQKAIEQEKMLLSQSKLASMGEIIDAIAHQWKQPLNTISLRADYLVAMNEGKEFVPMEDALECKESILQQVEHLVSTLNQFRDFLKPNTKKEQFDLKSSIQSVLTLIKDDFIHHKTNINIELDVELFAYGIENEFKHVILNILNNAKDIFCERDCHNRIIDITLESCNNKGIIKIQDNAGGVPDNIIEHIFENHISGKKEGSGTGIGLYMSKQIIDKIGANISVENRKDGACFTITIPLHQE
jgi:PAS domain S-box-containing protein